MRDLSSKSDQKGSFVSNKGLFESLLFLITAILSRIRENSFFERAERYWESGSDSQKREGLFKAGNSESSD